MFFLLTCFLFIFWEHWCRFAVRGNSKPVNSYPYLEVYSYVFMWDISLETLTKMFLITIFWGFEGIRQCLNISTEPHCCSVGIVAYRISTFVLNAPFLTALKTSENRKVFWCFQGEEKGCIGNNRIKALQWNQNFVQTSLRGSAELNQIIWAEPNYMWCY